MVKDQPALWLQPFHPSAPCQCTSYGDGKDQRTGHLTVLLRPWQPLDRSGGYVGGGSRHPTVTWPLVSTPLSQEWRRRSGVQELERRESCSDTERIDSCRADRHSNAVRRAVGRREAGEEKCGFKERKSARVRWAWSNVSGHCRQAHRIPAACRRLESGDCICSLYHFNILIYTQP